MTELLIVEDEESLAESLAFTLEKFGYKVRLAFDGLEAMRMLEGHSPDLILLDIMLPGKDGFQICKAVQESANPVPIIMITARTSETDRVVGLELGADDYVLKPFSTRELEARIKAVLRRRNATSGKKQDSDLQIDWERRIAKRKGELIQLSPKEWELLSCLAKQDRKILSKETLLNEVWGVDFDGDPKTVEIHVHWLRHKLESDPSDPKHIITVKRKGYRFEP